MRTPNARDPLRVSVVVAAFSSGPSSAGATRAMGGNKREHSEKSINRDTIPRVETPLTPGEHEEARRIARQMVSVLTDPSQDFVKLELDTDAKSKRIGDNAIAIALSELLNEPAPAIRLGAATRLLQKGWVRSRATEEFVKGLGDHDIITQLTAATFIGLLKIIPQEVEAALIPLFQGKDHTLRIAAAAALTDLPETITVLGGALGDENSCLAFMAAKGLIRRNLRVDDAVTVLLSLIQVRDFQLLVIAELCRLKHDSARIAPAFIELLKDPKTDARTRSVAVSGLGKLGQGGAAQAELTQALLDALQSGDWETACGAAISLKELGLVPKKVIRALIRMLPRQDVLARSTAAVILGEFGPRATDAIRPLLDRVMIENDMDVLVILARAISSIGLPESSIDPQFYDETLAALIERARTESNADLIPFRLQMFLVFGTRAVPALVQLAQGTDFGGVRIAVSALAMIGILSPNEVAPTIVDQLIAHGNARIRMTGADALAEMGSFAASAVPRLAGLLVEGDSLVFSDALRALRAIGADAREAAPSVIPLLSSEDQFHMALAEDVLLGIGSDAIPFLEAASAEAHGTGKQRIDSLLMRIGLPAGQRSGDEDNLLFRAIKRAWLETFDVVGGILAERGPTSFDEMAKEQELIPTLRKQARVSQVLPTSGRGLNKHIESLEEQLAFLLRDEAMSVKLIDRDSASRKKGGLTAFGRALLPRVRAYLSKLKEE
jgi:HEAT repeat protein